MFSRDIKWAVIAETKFVVWLIKHGLLCDDLNETIFHFAKSLYLAGKRRTWDDRDQRYYLDVSPESMRESLQIRDKLKEEVRMSKEGRMSPRRTSAMVEQDRRLSPRRSFSPEKRMSPRRTEMEEERLPSPRRSPVDEKIVDVERLSPRRSPVNDDENMVIRRSLSPRKSAQMSPRTIY